MGAVRQKSDASTRRRSPGVQLASYDCLILSSVASSKFSSLFSEFNSIFPEICAKKCVHLILTQPSLNQNDQISLFTAFFLLAKSYLSTINNESNDSSTTDSNSASTAESNSASTTDSNSSTSASPMPFLDLFLRFAAQEILSALKTASLQSLLDSIRFISTTLQSISSFLAASDSYQTFQSHVSWLSASWRDQSRSALLSLLQNWAEQQVKQLNDTASSVVSATDSVASLASTKREISQLFELIGSVASDR